MVTRICLLVRRYHFFKVLILLFLSIRLDLLIHLVDFIHHAKDMVHFNAIPEIRCYMSSNRCDPKVKGIFDF